jgi:hypothetical protein
MKVMFLRSGLAGHATHFCFVPASVCVMDLFIDSPITLAALNLHKWIRAVAAQTNANLLHRSASNSSAFESLA